MNTSNRPNSSSKRESRYVRVARISYALAQRTLPLYSHPKSPHHFTLPQLAACVLMAFYMKLSYRDMEEWLLATDAVCKLTCTPKTRPNEMWVWYTPGELRR